jgi:hypothetical protein
LALELHQTCFRMTLIPYSEISSMAHNKSENSILSPLSLENLSKLVIMQSSSFYSFLICYHSQLSFCHFWSNFLKFYHLHLWCETVYLHTSSTSRSLHFFFTYTSDSCNSDQISPLISSSKHWNLISFAIPFLFNLQSPDLGLWISRMDISGIEPAQPFHLIVIFY